MAVMVIVAIVQHVPDMQLRQSVHLDHYEGVTTQQNACSIVIHGELVVSTPFCQKKISRLLQIMTNE